MSDVKYDPEKLEADAQASIDKFRKRMRKVVDECFGEFYVNVGPYIETDQWTNYREALRTELEHEYKYTNFKVPWAKNFRRAIFIENRDELSQLISSDILERIKQLEDQRSEFEQFRYSVGSPKYHEVLTHADELAEALGMVDSVGMSEPYDKIVRDAINRYKKFRGEK